MTFAPAYITAERLRPENNSLTCVRLVLASAVILTHAFWKTTGVAGHDPLSPILGGPISEVAVDGFFFLSGFLVYRSLAARSAGSFLLARIARMYPALVASVALTVIGGMFVTRVDLATYFTGETAKFVAGNLSFAKGFYTLTGVSCDGAACNVNGSLWTLPWEMRCYLALLALSVIGLTSGRRFTVVLAASLVFAASWQATALPTLFAGHAGVAYWLNIIARLWTAFALGCGAAIWRDRIPLHGAILAALLAAWLLLPLTPATPFLRLGAIGYAILYAGFRGWPGQARIAALPDYSYGIYIYAYPVMVAIAAALPGVGPWHLAALNLMAVLPVAALSWHYLEEPVLKLVRRKGPSPGPRDAPDRPAPPPDRAAQTPGDGSPAG